MKRSPGLGCLCCLVAMLFLASTFAWAQAQAGGALKGTVVDELNSSRPLAAANVSLMGTSIRVATDSDGNFVIENIPAGAYRVTFDAANYHARTVDDVTITEGETTELNVELRLGFATEVTVTARRDETTLQSVPQNVEVVTYAELRDDPSLNIVGALNNVIGVDVETGSGISTVGSYVSINGYDDVYVKKMVDGVDIGEVVTNWSMLNSYPAEMLEQIDVVKGGSSAAWGSNMGGIINLVTKRPRGLSRPVINLRTSYGKYGKMDFEQADAFPNSGDLQRYSASLTGNADDLYYMLGYSRDVFDGFQQHSAEDNYSLFGKIGYNFSPDSSLDVLYNYNKLGNQFESFLSADFIPPGFYYWHYTSDLDSVSQVLSVKQSVQVNPELQFESQFKFTKWNYDAVQNVFADDFFDVPGQRTSSFTDQKWGLTAKAAYQPSAGLSVVSGVDYYRIRADFTHINNQPVIFIDTVAPFVDMQYTMGDVGLSVGARYDYDSSFGSQLSPTVGLNYSITPSTLVRANVARTFRVPPLWYTLGESYFDSILPNPDLLPERAWAYSVGFETQELRYVWAKVSLYYHKMTDGIGRSPMPGQPGKTTWANLDEYTRKGYEAELGFITGLGLTGYVGTNYNDHVEDTADGGVLTWIPTRTYKIGLKYDNRSADLMVNLRGRWIWWNESTFLMSLFDPQDKKWVFDLRMAKGFEVSNGARLGVFLDVFNLTDQLIWDRKDIPNPRRWIDFGIELNLR